MLSSDTAGVRHHNLHLQSLHSKLALLCDLDLIRDSSTIATSQALSNPTPPHRIRWSRGGERERDVMRQWWSSTSSRSHKRASLDCSKYKHTVSQINILTTHTTPKHTGKVYILTTTLHPHTHTHTRRARKASNVQLFIKTKCREISTFEGECDMTMTATALIIWASMSGIRKISYFVNFKWKQEQIPLINYFTTPYRQPRPPYSRQKSTQHWIFISKQRAGQAPIKQQVP